MDWPGLGWRLGRGALPGLFLLSLLVPGAAAVSAAELLMLEKPGCSWCARWDREIGPVYHKTDEGKRAALRRIDITQPWPKDLEGIRVDRFTPTFILIEDGTEIGRVRGYPGEMYFWPELDKLLQKLP